MDEDDRIDREIRAFVYRVVAARGTPPSPEQISAAFGLPPTAVQTALERLHAVRALALDPDDRVIRMAKPFSAVPTRFRVSANGRAWWANCAFDALGVAAALHDDAVIETRCARSRVPMTIDVRDGEVCDQGEVVHFPVPFAAWFDNLAAT